MTRYNFAIASQQPAQQMRRARLTLHEFRSAAAPTAESAPPAGGRFRLHNVDLIVSRHERLRFRTVDHPLAMLAGQTCDLDQTQHELLPDRPIEPEDLDY